MENVFLILLLLVAVVTGHVLSHHCPKIPLPFFLIGMGLIFAFIPLYWHFQFSPDIFTFAIIAPLMYNESKNASRYWIGRGIVNILSLAIILVILTVLAVGASLHALMPIFPLSLAFALCAIVTPTDASAVGAIVPESSEYQIPQTILKNESLFNDASGIVAFDLALAAYISGTFTVTTALSSFAREFLGGLLFGAVAGLIIAGIRWLLIRWGDDSPLILTTGEIATPFLIYFLADQIGVSGILAVVAAGLIQGTEREKLRLNASRMQLVSVNIWEMIDGTLTGLVFVLLGISLPQVFQAVLKNQQISWWQLVLAGLFIYSLKFVLRLVWSRYFVWMHKTSPHRWLDSWLMALSGANGTITLALALSLPLTINGHAFELRGSLIFIATIIILLSLVVPTLVLPYLLKSGPTTEEREQEWQEKMRLTAIELMEKSTDHPSEAQIVIDAFRQQLRARRLPYRRQLQRIFKQADSAEIKAIDALNAQATTQPIEIHYYHRFLAYSRFTVPNTWWRNLILRFWFGLHMGRLNHDVQVAQDTFMTTPIVMEQIYWQHAFETINRDIRPMETHGYQAALKQLATLRTPENQESIDAIEQYYHERHRRFALQSIDESLVYELFLSAFHAEYELAQAAFHQQQISAELTQSLQEQITLDEASYLKNRKIFNA